MWRIVLTMILEDRRLTCVPVNVSLFTIPALETHRAEDVREIDVDIINV